MGGGVGVGTSGFEQATNKLNIMNNLFIILL
jgi:hypothetical protein